jgi:hypothetical protein
MVARSSTDIVQFFLLRFSPFRGICAAWGQHLAEVGRCFPCMGSRGLTVRILTATADAIAFFGRLELGGD